jgi:predicted RNase H-like HicB family nuclease
VREQAIAVELTERGPSNLVLLTLELTQEEDVWVGTCIELGTSTYADSLEELRGELADAIGLQLNEAMRLGFIDDYIQERNVRTLPLIQLEDGSGAERERFGLVAVGI